VRAVIPPGHPDGTTPVRLLLVRSRVFRAPRADQEGGKEPGKGLLAVDKRVKELSKLHWEGRDDENLRRKTDMVDDRNALPVQRHKITHPLPFNSSDLRPEAKLKFEGKDP
jgi:hypothetical protein